MVQKEMLLKVYRQTVDRWMPDSDWDELKTLTISAYVKAAQFRILLLRVNLIDFSTFQWGLKEAHMPKNAHPLKFKQLLNIDLWEEVELNSFYDDWQTIKFYVTNINA